MKRSSFIKSLGVLAGVSFIPKLKPEKLTLLSHTSNADVSIGVNSVERMRIISNGNIGICYTKLPQKLYIQGTIIESKNIQYEVY
jgi:hypothetical protein